MQANRSCKDAAAGTKEKTAAFLGKDSHQSMIAAFKQSRCEEAVPAGCGYLWLNATQQQDEHDEQACPALAMHTLAIYFLLCRPINSWYTAQECKACKRAIPNRLQFLLDWAAQMMKRVPFSHPNRHASNAKTNKP